MKNIIISVVIASLVTALALVGFQKPAETVVSAVPSPDLLSPYFSFGGVRSWAAHTDSLTAATTTVCALQSPAATSTLRYGSINFTVSSTTASTVTVAKATTAYATTTLINTVSLSANAQGVALFASTTNSALEQTNKTFAPNTYLVVGMAGGAGTFSPTGSCSAVWTQDAY